MTGKDLKNKLELTGIPLRQIAEALNISEQNLQNKMSSADIKVSFLCRISKVIHKSIYFLLDGQDFYKEAAEVNKWSNMPTVTPISKPEESFIYKMYEKEKEEHQELIRENGRLEERIRILESKLKELESEPKMNTDHPRGLGLPDTAKNANSEKCSLGSGLSAKSVQNQPKNQ